MRIPIRLYRGHDFDLVIMKLSGGYKLGPEMKKCLIAYSKGELYTPPAFDFDGDYNGYVRYSYMLQVVLNPDNPDEAGAIDLITQIRPGYRCSFLKALFRNNIPCLPLLQYAKDSLVITRRITAKDIDTERKKAFEKQIRLGTDIKTKETGKEETVNLSNDADANEEVSFDFLGALDALENPG